MFADTQDEPLSVYKWLDWLEKQLPFPVHRVTAGKLSNAALIMRNRKRDGAPFTQTNIPFWTLSATNQLGRITHRGCTSDFKIKPILKAVKKIANIQRGQKSIGVIQWIGMKESRDPWVENRWPLIDARMSRQDCLKWMKARDFPEPPRSACVYCPFHNNYEWRRLKQDEPLEFEKAVRFEKAVQASKRTTANFASVPFLHRTCVALDKIDFLTEEERGQLNMFNNECEGMCGV